MMVEADLGVPLVLLSTISPCIHCGLYNFAHQTYKIDICISNLNLEAESPSCSCVPVLLISAMYRALPEPVYFAAFPIKYSSVYRLRLILLKRRTSLLLTIPNAPHSSRAGVDPDRHHQDHLY